MKPSSSAYILLVYGVGHAGAVTAPLRGLHPAAGADLAQVHDKMLSHEAYGFGGVSQAEGTTYFFYGVLGVLVLAVLGFAAWGMAQRRAAAAADEKVQPLAPDAEAPQAAEAAAPEAAREAAPEQKTIDLEHFFQLLAKRAVHQIGPKLTKANNVRSVLYKQVSGFQQKALGFIGNELLATLAQLLREADAEEAMLLFNPSESLAANIPPLSIMLAGLLSPAVLTMSLIIHLSQVVLVLIPVIIMCAISLYVDHDTLFGCAVPTLWFWVYFQLCLASVLTVAHLMTVVQLQVGKASIQEKVSDMQGRFSEALADGELSVAEMRELFVIITILLEHSLVVEDSLRQSVWRKVIGWSTIVWILATVWTFVIVLGYTFVPGAVAFAQSAAGVAGGAYCGAWASVLSARLACVLSLFFLLFNLLSVVQFLSDMLILSDAWSAQWLGMARKFDASMLGFPVVQTIVRAFILRGTADTLRSQIALAKDRDLQLHKKKDELAGRISTLKARILHHKAEASALKSMVGPAGGPSPDMADLMRMDTPPPPGDTEALAKLGEEAARHAQEVERATKEELEQLYNKILDSVAHIREMSAEAYAQAQLEMERNVALAQAAAQEGLSAAELAARQAAAAGTAAASDAAGRASQHAEEARAAAARAQSEAEGRCRQS